MSTKQSGYQPTMMEQGRQRKRRQLHPAAKLALLFTIFLSNAFLLFYGAGWATVAVENGKIALDNFDSFVTSFAIIFIIVQPGAIAFSWYFLEVE